MTGPENDGIRVLCSSSGWFPKPKVQWRDTSGNTLLSSSELQTQDREGLFQVEVSLLVGSILGAAYTNKYSESLYTGTGSAGGGCFWSSLVVGNYAEQFHDFCRDWFPWAQNM